MSFYYFVQYWFRVLRSRKPIFKLESYDYGTLSLQIWAYLSLTHCKVLKLFLKDTEMN